MQKARTTTLFASNHQNQVKLLKTKTVVKNP